MDEFLVCTKEALQLLFDLVLCMQHLLNDIARKALNHIVVGEIEVDEALVHLYNLQ